MKPELAAWMRAAWDAGFSVVPIGPGKSPTVPWKHLIERQCELDQLLIWLAEDHDGYGILGGGSERLVWFDFEAGFDFGAFGELLRDAGLFDVFESWASEFWVRTPKGGMHVGVKLMGSEPVPGNTKLAYDSSGHVTVELRGDRGLVVGAFSNGETHPNGGQWQPIGAAGFDGIRFVERADFDAVCAVLASMDESPTPTPQERIEPTPAGSVSLGSLLRSTSWIDSTTKPAMAEVLASYGWQFHHQDADYTYWTRPGKEPRLGVSATINANDRLHCHSSNAHPVPLSVNNQSFDVVDIIGCYELGRAPSLDERTEIMRRWRPAPPPPRGAAAGGKQESLSSQYLPDDFWTATVWLEALHAVALQRGRSPEAVLGAVITTYATVTPMPFKIPAIVGVPSPLNMYSALVSRSGKGKSGSMALARPLVGVGNSSDYKFGSLRSGEGLIAMARMPQRKGDESGPSYRRGIMVDFDEVKTLQAQSDRSGSTTLSYLSTAWSGLGDVGGSKSAGDDSFPGDLVRVCAVMGVQLGVAGSLFTGESAAQGFPGRFMYFGLDNPILPTLPKDASLAPDAPAVLPIRRYSYDEAREVGSIGVPDYVIIATKEWDADDSPRDLIDGHRWLLRLRCAALLALMSGHVYIDDLHWQLSGALEEHSLSLRNQMVAAIGQHARDRAVQAGRLDAYREQGRNDAWCTQRAERIARWVHEQADPSGHIRKDLKGRLASHERPRLGEIIAYMETSGWVIHRDGRWFPGRVRPV